MSHQYTAVGYWNDQDEITIVGIVQGSVENVFGGDGCSEGGPWASASFWATDDDHAERVAANEARIAAAENRGEDIDEEDDGNDPMPIGGTGGIGPGDHPGMDNEGPTGLVHGPRLGPTI